jgi:hypothetical protein
MRHRLTSQPARRLTHLLRRKKTVASTHIFMQQRPPHADISREPETTPGADSREFGLHPQRHIKLWERAGRPPKLMVP